eukprot:3802133-Karenia_brevis.AAC.1
MGHAVYRNWCGVCVRARSKEWDCSRDKGKERRSGALMATTVPHTRVGEVCFAVDRCLDFVDENGDAKVDISIKSDTEEAMKMLVRSIQEERVEGKIVVEEAPRRVKGSNSVVESAVQESKGRIRSISLSMEERLWREVDPRERI